jgi:hypothetical protein
VKALEIAVTSLVFEILRGSGIEKARMASLRMLSYIHIMEWLMQIDLIQRGQSQGLTAALKTIGDSR